MFINVAFETTLGHFERDDVLSLLDPERKISFGDFGACPKGLKKAVINHYMSAP